MSDEVKIEEVKEEPELTPEDQMQRVFMQMNTLYGTLAARLMIMLINDTIAHPWIGATHDEVWCMPDHHKFCKVLGLKWIRQKDTVRYFSALNKLSDDGWICKALTTDKKHHQIYWVNWDRLNELCDLPRYVSSIPAALLTSEKYKAALEKFHVEQNKIKEAENAAKSADQVPSMENSAESPASE